MTAMKTTRTKKTTVITTEQHEVWVVRQGTATTEAVPPDSTEQSAMVALNEPRPEEAAPDDESNDSFKE